MLPRKTHLKGIDGRQRCTTPYVQAKHLTDDPAKVTCKLCGKIVATDGLLSNDCSSKP